MRRSYPGASFAGEGDRARVDAARQLVLELERVDDFKKGEAVKIHIACADPSDPMLTHEDRCVRVVQQVA